jgi:hypothetical protein
MQAEIENDKLKTLAKLQAGLADRCADDIVEVLINLDTGTCDYVSLIPVLEEIARVEWFYYFDDNGAGGSAHPVTGDRTNLKSWALKAIDNIRENELFDSTTAIHSALKSNNTELVKNTLEQLKAEKRSTDKSLIPILEKIARKDVYKKYSYMLGFETDCQLGDLARAVVQMITHDPASADTSDKPTSTPKEEPGKCSVCISLPDDLTVNTGREEYFPSAFNQLVGMDDDRRAEFRCCPGCRTYFKWFDMTQMYGSGNNDEERLVRLSPEKSRLLDKLFTAGLSYRPTSIEIEEYAGSLPLDLLVPALSFQLHRNQELVRSFVPRLIALLGKNNDDSLWSLLNGYANSRERAEEILDAFRTSEDYPPNRLIQIIHQCLKLLNKSEA